MRYPDAFSAVTTHSCATMLHLCATHTPLLRHSYATFAPPMRRRNASPSFSAPARSDAPAPSGGPGWRGHGFPRSHGPAEHEVNGSWLRLRCRRRRPPSRVTWIGRRVPARGRKKCRTNPKAAEIRAYPRKGTGKTGVAHRRHALSPAGGERGEASSPLDARSPRATRCTSARRPDSGCSRS
jgi:hypothetical protein